MNSPKSLSSLCIVSREACALMSSMIFTFYASLDSGTSKIKDDKSAFTIADGMVQHLLQNHLFHNKFNEFVGEESVNVNILTRPYFVDDMIVPDDYFDLIDETRLRIERLADKIDSSAFRNITPFIDPIDGTKEFSSGLGEQCSICIGFSDADTGLPLAGVIYRPLSSPNTWAMGSSIENFRDSYIDNSSDPSTHGFLTSNGAISPFISQLIAELEYDRVPSGGAGNKVLMLLEGKGACYIQDRGVSRWDTCAAQAVLEAHNGVLTKLTSLPSPEKVAADRARTSYTYRRSTLNLDFVPGLSRMTRYNSLVHDHHPSLIGQLAGEEHLVLMKPYSNLCGLFAVTPSSAEDLPRYLDAIARAQQMSPPAYD